MNPSRLILSLLFLTSALRAEIPRDLFGNYCTDCHDSEEQKGGIDLEGLKWNPDDKANLERWMKIHDVIRDGEMPPKNRKTRPEAKEAEDFLKSLGGEIRAADAKRAKNGRTVLRRMNRFEYERSVQELLGIHTPLAAMLPADASMHGFDTVAEGLRLSTLQIEKYLEAADAAIESAIYLKRPRVSETNRIPLKKAQDVRWHLDKPEGKSDGAGGAAAEHKHLLLEKDDAIVFFNEGYPAAMVKQPKQMPGGMYKIRISGYAFQSEGEHVPMRIYASNYKEKRMLGWFEMPPDKARTVEFTTYMRSGEFLHIEPTNTGRDPDGKSTYQVPIKEFKGSGLGLQWVEFEGPLDEPSPPKGITALFHGVPLVETSEKVRKEDWSPWFELKPNDPKADAKVALEYFAKNAFRRDLDAGEIDRYIALVHQSLDDGKPFVESMKIGFRAILTAPQFLFFEEYPGKLDDPSLAVRLSYFFWSAPPDAELLKLADEKKLSDPKVLHAQVERLLKDKRSAAFVEDFTGQWLDLRNIEATTPDEQLYPESDELLRLSMVGETHAFFTELLQSDLPVSNVVSSDFVMVNSRLAEHYQLPKVDTEGFTKMKLPADSVRGGFLTQAGILKVTANGTTTSPVLRGAWVMKKILGLPPSPPPPGVGSIEPDTRGATTVREQLAKHRESESCAGCHAKIDPPGFALESFDVIGGFRGKYRSQGEGETITLDNSRKARKYVKLGQPVDPSGEFDGKAFADIKEFKKLLLDDSDQVMRSLAGKLVTYSTGAGISFSDREAVEEICRKTKEQGGGLRTLVHQIVASPLFQSK